MAGYRNPGYLPHHHVILTKNSKLLRTTLADEIKIIAHNLNERFVLSDYQLNVVLKKAPQQPDDGVFELIKILKGSPVVNFERFIECLNDLGYLGLVQKLTENTIPQIETRPSPSTNSNTVVSALSLQTVTQPSPSTSSSSTDPGSALVSQTETLHGNTRTEIRVSIIGKTGVGKSALGNALLQHDTFKSQQKTTSVTSECGSGQRILQLNGVDTLLKVVDTPGLFDTGNSNKTIAKEIVKCINLLPPGPHLFIMVFRIDHRLSQEDIKVLEYFKNTFGEMIDKFAVVVFTGKDQLVDRSEESAICEFRSRLSTLSDIFKHRRFATINNKDTTEGKTGSVKRILELLQTTIQNNGVGFYKNEMYEAAKRQFEARIREVKQKTLAKLDGLTQQIKHFKQREEQQKQRETDLRKRELELKRKEDLIHVKDQESPPHAKRRKVITRREKGKMSPEDDCRIISNYVYLTENLDPLQPLLDSLIEMYVLNEDDLEKIRRAESSGGTKTMIRQFLDILRTCGINVFSKFIHCLMKSGYKAVAEQLTSDTDMDGIIKREVKQLRAEKKCLRLQQKLQQIKREKQEGEQALHISAQENRRIKTTLNSWRIALKTKTNIMVRFKSEMRTKTKLLDQLKKERDTRNEDLQMTKVRNSILCDELERIHEQNVIIDRIKEEFDDDDDDDDGQDKVVENTCVVIKQEPQEIDETCDVIQSTDLSSNIRPDIDQTHEVSQLAVDQQDNTTLLRQGHHSPNLETCLQSSQHQDLESGQPSTSSSLDSSPINQRKDDTTPVKTSPVYDDDTTPVKTSPAYDDDKVIRPVDKYTLFKVCEHSTLDKLKSILSDKTIDINSTGILNRTAMYDCIISSIQPVEKLDLLTSSGAKLDVKDMFGDSLLHVACENGCVKTVEWLLNKGKVDIECMNYYNKTPILVAIRSDKQPVEKLNLLVSSGAKLDVKDRRDNSLLHVACEYGCVETVEWLLKTGRVDIDSMNSDDNTPILVAIRSYKQPVAKMKVLANFGAKLGVKARDGNSLLHVACRDYGVETVEWLLKTGRLDMESENQGGSTPILVAIHSYKQPVEKLNLLITSGAKLDVKDSYDNSLLHLACMYGCVETVEWLLNTDRVDIESKNQGGNTPILVAIHSYKQPVEKLNLLITSGAKLDVKDSYDNSLLHLACMYGCVETVEWLLNTDRVDIESKNQVGSTPIRVAIHSDKQPVEKMEVLANRGAKLDVKDRNGNSLLHVACRDRWIETVEWLLNKGRVDMECKNSGGYTPIVLAIRSDKQPVEKLKVLAHFGANLDFKNGDGNNILHIACRYCGVETVACLLNTGRVDIESKNNDGETPILVAIRSDKQPVEKMKVLANFGATLNLERLLHVVCRYHKVEDVEFLLSKNVDIEIRNEANETPIISALRSSTQPGQKAELLLDKGAKLDHSSNILHYACQCGSLDCVKYFIDKGLDIDSINDKNESPLMIAICSTIQSLPKVKMLLDAGAKLDNILHYACQYGSLGCVKYFIDKGFNMEARNDRNESLLMLAICSTIQSLQKVKVLLNAGAKLDSSPNILHYACQYGSLGCVKYFIKKKFINIESRDDYNRTPLFYCVLTKRIKFKNKIDLLMSMNVNKMVRDVNNLSVLQFARKHARYPRVEYLTKNGFTN